MNRKACLTLLATLPFLVGAGRIATEITLDAGGQGAVVVTLRTTLDEVDRLARLEDPALKRSMIVRQITASPRELAEILREQGMIDVSVEQAASGSVLTTRAAAYVGDVRALAGCGGDLDFAATPDNALRLKGLLGGALRGQKCDRSALKDVAVTLTIVFPGSVRKTDAAARLSHSGRAVSYQWSADELLADVTPVEVRVIPDIEGAPYFWLALILGLAMLVALGTVIVLHGGRDALKGGRKG